MVTLGPAQSPYRVLAIFGAPMLAIRVVNCSEEFGEARHLVNGENTFERRAIGIEVALCKERDGNNPIFGHAGHPFPAPLTSKPRA